MNSGTIQTGNSNAVYNSDSAVFNINEGTIANKSNSYPTVYLKRTKISDSPTLNINGGTIKNTGSSCEVYKYTEYGIGIGRLKTWYYPTVNVNGGNYGEIWGGHP